MKVLLTLLGTMGFTASTAAVVISGVGQSTDPITVEKEKLALLIGEAKELRYLYKDAGLEEAHKNINEAINVANNVFENSESTIEMVSEAIVTLEQSIENVKNKVAAEQEENDIAKARVTLNSTINIAQEFTDKWLTQNQSKGSNELNDRLQKEINIANDTYKSPTASSLEIISANDRLFNNYIQIKSEWFENANKKEKFDFAINEFNNSIIDANLFALKIEDVAPNAFESLDVQIKIAEENQKKWLWTETEIEEVEEAKKVLDDKLAIAKKDAKIEQDIFELKEAKKIKIEDIKDEIDNFRDINYQSDEQEHILAPFEKLKTSVESKIESLSTKHDVENYDIKPELDSAKKIADGILATELFNLKKATKDKFEKVIKNEQDKFSSPEARSVFDDLIHTVKNEIDDLRTLRSVGEYNIDKLLEKAREKAEQLDDNELAKIKREKIAEVTEPIKSERDLYHSAEAKEHFDNLIAVIEEQIYEIQEPDEVNKYEIDSKLYSEHTLQAQRAETKEAGIFFREHFIVIRIPHFSMGQINNGDRICFVKNVLSKTLQASFYVSYYSEIDDKDFSGFNFVTAIIHLASGDYNPEDDPNYDTSETNIKFDIREPKGDPGDPGIK